MFTIIEYAFILCPGGLILPKHLPEPFKPKQKQATSYFGLPNVPMTMVDAEKIIIEKALQRNKWKKMATCHKLNISKDTLRQKIKRYNLKEQDIISTLTDSR